MFTFGESDVIETIIMKKKKNFVMVPTPSSFLIWDGIHVADLKPDHSKILQLMFVSCLTASSECKLFFDKQS